MKTAIVVAAHDGLVSLVTGVGVMVNSFIESFEEIKKKSNTIQKNKPELIALAPYLKENSKDYNRRVKQKTKQICEANGGKLVNLPTFSDGSSEASVWGGLQQWGSASLSAASYITAIYDNYDSIVLLAHDTIFSSIRKYTLNYNKLKIVWIPHSLGGIFKDEFGSERLALEKEAINLMQRTKQDFIGYISNSFKKVLHEEYGVANKKLIPFINGVYVKSSRFDIPSSIRAEDIKEIGIPLDKKLIFCWGRCVYQKGYDILIPAYNELVKDHPNYHLVLLMPTETSTQDYVSKIKKQISKLDSKSITAVYNFKETLPYSILRHPSLEMVIFPSRFEGAPITPLEALSFAKNDVKFVYSAIPPLKEIFMQDNRSVPVKNLTINSLYEGMELAVKKNRAVAEKGSITNFVDSYAKGLDTILEER